MTIADAPIAQTARPPRTPWFHSARFDWLLILGVPFLTWPLVMAAQGAWGPDLLNKLILLTASGHYFATFARAYGDRELFDRFHTRFLLVPAVLLVVSIALVTGGHAAPLILVTAAWAFWHWLAQAFGFARIYDMKVGSFRPMTARLDKLLVITGFVGAVVLNSGPVATFGKVFLDAGISLPSAAQFTVVQDAVLVAMVVVAVAYVANLLWTIARGQPWSWQKQVMHVTTIGYYWFAFAYLPNVLVAYVLYELFHDIQYYAITWLTCTQRVQRPGVTPWLARMFRPGWAAAVGFLLVMTLFGAADLGGRHVIADPLLRDVSLGVFVTAALLHYYYDGFIWKARENTLGSDLGIAGGLRAAFVPGLRHSGYWAIFFVPLAGIILFAHGEFSPRERASALVGVAPDDFLSQAELGFELAKDGEMRASLDPYRASIAANPNYAPAHANYGNALDFLGDLDGAVEQYEAALACPAHGAAHQQAHVNLGVLLLLSGDRDGAQEHFDAGRRLGGEEPLARMRAMAAALPAEDEARRRELLLAVLQLDPTDPDANFHLAQTRLAEQRLADAARHYSAVLQARPNFVPALVGMAAVQAQSGQLDPARATLQRALELEPGNARAQQMMRLLDEQ